MNVMQELGFESTSGVNEKLADIESLPIHQQDILKNFKLREISTGVGAYAEIPLQRVETWGLKRPTTAAAKSAATLAARWAFGDEFAEGTAEYRKTVRDVLRGDKASNNSFTAAMGKDELGNYNLVIFVPLRGRDPVEDLPTY